ncbi:mitochondrial 54S ribosomal protein mL57 [Aspergillus homomorphus CBS 101889]|uniref:RNase III domain protein n=1 Tax=Aspergillus homomorphus (strain CBS 101889) TaxID=1450537 RepID=A0A395HZF9_ASPHC|nr:RNase III domain protein [Aspergillus homomorphus CBS 101889]RAL12773.1 RNase III domain protein [Aspergillus homomorphus CBS 101889]
MASKLSTRAVTTLSGPACRTVVRSSAIESALLPRRALSTSTEEAPVDNRPRWSYTPERAKAPFSLRLDSKRPPFSVNSDPKILDQFYIRLLGPDGDKVLSDEVKWLAVTHKSFDQGRRGYNDRIAFLGKRIVKLQASLALVGHSAAPPSRDAFGRKPFRHPALEGLNNLSFNTKNFMTHKSKLADLAQKYQLQKVLRWAPRMPLNLESSGLELILAHTMYAIVGAIALEKGGNVANQVARERILKPLGFRI